MNKNLVDYRTDWAEVVREDFETSQEAEDWMLYQLVELQRLLRHHLHHRVRSSAFVRYVSRARGVISGEFINYMNMVEDKALQSHVCSKVNVFIEKMLEDIERLNRIPFSER